MAYMTQAVKKEESDPFEVVRARSQLGRLARCWGKAFGRVICYVGPDVFALEFL